MTVPEGYHCTFDESWFRPWICDRCGASVVASAFETHDAWHRTLEMDLAHTDQRIRSLAQAFNDSQERVHVALSSRIPL